ncbi:hypothetical protein [Micromonospora sp. WMMD710]|uniref:hypothetical protein n=1 Tax=Micromonospora sp. WMMD710 TaxID=3016085 RepID=UPI0024173B86|nr:hypothetical protein [Micromonospora sp. WMMD710]MDG4761331.1 hypothetical protein [Micromonospora sp. WMMD710]
MVDTAAVQQALANLATRLATPVDFINIHRANKDEAKRNPRYRSMRYGSFLHAYGPFEMFFNELIGAHGGPRQGTPATMDRIRERIAQHLQIPNVTRQWQARVRTQPLPGRGGRWLWTTIQTQRLGDYLRDAKAVRNRLAHGDDPHPAPNTSGTLYDRKDGKTSITLMWVEGFVQATQDLATITALELTNDTTLVPDWPEPPRTGVSANPPPPPYALTP